MFSTNFIYENNIFVEQFKFFQDFQNPPETPETHSRPPKRSPKGPKGMAFQAGSKKIGKKTTFLFFFCIVFLAARSLAL
jgi:hypothetical protein